MGLTDFFAMEAGDYLERLDGLVSKGSLDADEFLRVSRALRGSALMANQQVVAAAAAGFELVAKAIREGRQAWDARTQQAVVRAVDDFKVLVRRLREWTAEDDERARTIGASLEEVAGEAAAPTPPPAATGGARARALIAQQGATLASALDGAATAIQADPRAPGGLNAVLQVMQPIRGIASLMDFPPLPDILDALERSIAEARRQPRPPAELPEALRAGARAVARVAREITASGTADPESPELAELVSRLATVMGLDSSILPIESLFFDDAGPHALEPGVAPVALMPPGGPQFVAQGEYLQQAADAIERGRSAPERELRAQGLLGTFRTLAAGGDGPLAEAAAALGRAGRDALAYGWASMRTAEFVALLRRAGDTLSGAGRLAEPRLATELDAVTAMLREAVSGAVAARRLTPAPAPREAATPAEAAPAAEPVAAETDGDPPGLVGSYRRYERLLTALGMGTPSVEALLAGPPVLPVAKPAAAPPAAVRRAPAPAVAPAPAAEAVPQAAEVPIGTLLYDGPAALTRALSLREDVRRVLESPTPDTEAARELVEEILDLVQLGQARP
jgi:hypothetical protein